MIRKQAQKLVARYLIEVLEGADCDAILALAPERYPGDVREYSAADRSRVEAASADLRAFLVRWTRQRLSPESMASPPPPWPVWPGLNDGEVSES